jgi:hypothetical protein
MLSFAMLGTSGRRTPFRHLALLVALAQGLLFAAAPFAEARLEHAPRQAGIERRHTHACTPLHQPDKCAFCQLGTARARRTDAVTLEAGGRIVLIRFVGSRPAEPPVAELHAPRSRAPPTTLA